MSRFSLKRKNEEEDLIDEAKDDKYEYNSIVVTVKNHEKTRGKPVSSVQYFRPVNGSDVSRRDAPLPELNWVDKQEMWELMEKKETRMYKRQNPNEILSRHPAIEPRMRAILIDWLSEVCEVYKMHRETFYLAVDFLDRFLGVAEYVSRDKLQLVGVTCLFIGSKIEEIYPPPVKEFAYVTDGACTIEDIKLTELDIVKKLNWGLAPMTPNSWMKVFMQVVQGPKTVADSCTLPSYSGFEFSMAMQTIDLCILDIGSLRV